MGRLAAFTAAFALSGLALADPCAGLPPGHLKTLQTRLTHGTEPQWPALLAEAEAAARGAASPGDRACAHYVAGSAAFFLSRPEPQRAERAWQAVRHLVTAQALAPAALADKRALSRLTTAWERVPGPVDWPAERPPEAVTLDSDGAPLRLWPPVDAPAIELALTPGRHLLWLRPGPWRLERVDARCSAGPIPATLGGPPTLTPRAACPFPLELVDAHGPVPDARLSTLDGAPVDPPRGGSPLKISAPGYLDRIITPPADGSPLRVSLERCPVAIEVITEPAAVPVAGAEPGPWGPRTLTLWPASPRPAPLPVEIPRPADCAGARHQLTARAPHPVVAEARDAEGRPTPLSRLIIGQQAHDPKGFFLPPGPHVYQASRPAAGLHIGRIDVPPCARSEGCAPLRLIAGPPQDPAPEAAPPGATVSLALGGVLTGAGLVVGALALSTQGEIDRYTSPAQTGRGLDRLVDRRDDQALAADVLLGIGLTGLAIGLVWSLLER